MRAAVMVEMPIPSPMKRMTFFAGFRPRASIRPSTAAADWV
jgi:hypothetical protein